MSRSSQCFAQSLCRLDVFSFLPDHEMHVSSQFAEYKKVQFYKPMYYILSILGQDVLGKVRCENAADGEA